MSTANLPNRFVTVDENGWIIYENQQITDPAIASIFYQDLNFLPNRSFCSSILGEPVIVEAFDAPMIVQNFRVDTANKKVTLEFNYHYFLEFDFKIFISAVLTEFFLDLWDRLCGEGPAQIPFVFSKKAHAQFLDSLDEFDDDSVIFNGHHIKLKSFWQEDVELDEPAWWDRVYTGDSSLAATSTPAWSLDAPAPTLKDMLPRMKLPKSRVLILGCGDSYDAALFAEAGHMVTAVDFSSHAIERSKQLFGHLKNITWLQADLFKLPLSFNNSFDLVYEYACLCAVNPTKRSEMIKTWSRCLHEQGQIMATFFCMHKRAGPPFGGSEWEFRELLKKQFQTLIWTRWRKSLLRRQGRELFVLAQKRKSL